MARPRFRSLLKRARAKVGGGPGRPGGPGADPGPAFALLDQEVDAALQLLGASTVSAWEVLLTDTGRAMASAGLDEAARGPRLERISDALVPTQQPLQDLGRQGRQALKDALPTAHQAPDWATALAPFLGRVDRLGESLAKGLDKTATHVQPALEGLGPSSSVIHALQYGGAQLHKDCDQAAQGLRAQLAKVPAGADAPKALSGAVDDWRQAVARSLETELYGVRTALVEFMAQD